VTLPWRKFLIAPGLVERTAAELKTFNTTRHDNEGFVYWAGRTAGRDCIALTLYRPNATVTSGSVDIDEAENTRYVEWLRRNQLTHVGQVHTHPPGIDEHSEGDDHWAFMKFRGLLSIVVPNYGKDGMIIERCAFHFFDGEGFQQLTRVEVRDTIVLLRGKGP